MVVNSSEMLNRAILRKGEAIVKITVVTTTIRIPRCIESYIKNFRTYGWNDVRFLVIGDMKTPSTMSNYLEGLSDSGCHIDYWDVERQRKWLGSFPKLDDLIPYNSTQRRNIGYLLAYEQDAEVIISIDDDNFAIADNDFIKGHCLVGQKMSLTTVKSSTDWFNPCDLLLANPDKRIYHRGFPYSKRSFEGTVNFGTMEGRVVVNEGLWLGVPDVDAATHLQEPVEIIGFKRDLQQGHVALAQSTYSPFNTQNTAFHAELLPCMYLPEMETEVSGISIDRYEDIWSSYFAQKIIKHFGDAITFGEPLVRHDRNPHDHMKDLVGELPGILLTEKLIKTLESITLSEISYLECYKELLQALRSSIYKDNGYSRREKAYLLRLTDGMNVWADTVSRIDRV